VVITFGVDSPGVAPGKLTSASRCAPVNNVPAPWAGTLLVSAMFVLLTTHLLNWYLVQAMQCTKCSFYCSSRQSKVSRWHRFNFCGFTFMFWFCIGWLATLTEQKTSKSEIISNFKDFWNVKIAASVWNTLEHVVYYLCLASLARDAHLACVVSTCHFGLNDVQTFRTLKNRGLNV